jgi:anti-sigma-K factor RskA
MSVAFERIDELLAQRAIEGLSAAETVELEQLIRHYPSFDSETLERAAAAVAVAMLDRFEPLPPGLRRRIEADAATALPPPVVPKFVRPAAPRASVWPWLAAAAALAVAAIGWWPGDGTRSPAAERAALIAAGAAPVQWAPTADPAGAGASGDIVWDGRTQQGVMRFTALAANEPTRFQYQLWIFDAARDERYPVDGGVFDIPAGGGEILVPIRAKLPVSNAVLFAVTVEAPGGVVVSGRERIVLTAELG